LIERQACELGLIDIARRIKSTVDVVPLGPFAGMRIDPDFLPIHVGPKLLGTYENELHEPLEKLISRHPTLVINVGCAEGYYAVGMARRLPKAKVMAFDADPKARRAPLGNAALNQVHNRIRVLGILKRPQLESIIYKENALLICDCEGGEFDLLDSIHIPSLHRTDILVELHPSIYPTIAHLMEVRFKSTHHIEIYEAVAANIKSRQAPGWLPEEIRIPATDESRDRNIWLAMFSRSEVPLDPTN
jgi:hypothetical protein